MSDTVNKTLYVLGGHDMQDAPSGPAGYRNDVWASDDGARWTQVTAHAAWSPRDTCVRMDQTNPLIYTYIVA